MSKPSGEQQEIDNSRNQAEKDNLKAQIESAKLLGIDAVRSVIDLIHQSALDPQEKAGLIAEAAKALLETETKGNVANKEALASTVAAQEPLQTAEEEKKRYELLVRSTYDEFDKFHGDLLKKENNLNDSLERALQEIESGKGISEETKKAIIKAEEELLTNKYGRGDVKKTKDIAIGEQAYHTEQLLAIERALQQGGGNLSKAQLDEKREFHKGCLAESHAKLEQVEKHEVAEKKRAAIIEKGIEQVKAKGNAVDQSFLQSVAAKLNNESPRQNQLQTHESVVTNNLDTNSKAKLEDIKKTMQQHTTGNKANNIVINNNKAKEVESRGF